MNLIVLNGSEWINENTIKLYGRQFDHIMSIHKVKIGDTVRIGLLNDKIGEGRILELREDYAVLEVILDKNPPEKLPLKLILAMPRPKVFKRLVEDCTTLGIGEIHLIKTWKVEKSYWSTPWLDEEKLMQQIILGLEQGKDTFVPVIKIHKQFKPFVEDELPEIIKGTNPLIAHPRVDEKIKLGDFSGKSVTLAIGPEGGFTDYEVGKFEEIGFEAVSLGDRILRVETAVKVIVGKLYY